MPTSSFWEDHFLAYEQAAADETISDEQWRHITKTTEQALLTFNKALFEERGYGFQLEDIVIIEDGDIFGVPPFSTVSFFGTDLGIVVEAAHSLSSSGYAYNYLPHHLIDPKNEEVYLLAQDEDDPANYPKAALLCRQHVLESLNGICAKSLGFA